MGHNAPLNGAYMENYMDHVLIYDGRGGGGEGGGRVSICMWASVLFFVCVCACLLSANNGLQRGRLSDAVRALGGGCPSPW